MRLNFPAFIIQFSFVACFFWLNAMCIEMWLLVRFYVGKCRNRENCKRTESRTLFFWYSLWCWGPSVILILVSMIMDLNPMIPATYVKNSGKESCSFKGKLSIWISFQINMKHFEWVVYNLLNDIIRILCRSCFYSYDIFKKFFWFQFNLYR